MVLFRDIKRKARRDLHGIMQVPALYLVETGPGPTYSETPVTVRLHTKFKTLGDQKGTNFHYAEIQEAIPRVVFMRSEVDKPERGAIVSIAADEAYRVDNVLPSDDIAVVAEVSRLGAAELVGLPVPEAA